jgi:PTH1 family peptidyl-tRNA hydrolase
MRLIAGLGNPGARYRDTPHNAGFRVCDRLAERHGLEPAVEKFEGLFQRGRVAGKDVGILKPQTYMNLSGESIARAIRYLPTDVEDLIVVYDDMDLPSGRLRIRPRGGAGGHNGLKSIIRHLGTQEFARIRIGVGRPTGERSATGHLLGRVNTEERERFDETVALAVDALETMLTEGIDEAMNRYNGLAPISNEEDEK